MIRAVVVSACFAYGFAFSLADHMLRVATWVATVALLGAVVGVSPWVALFLCVAGNAVGRMLYPEVER